MGLRRGRTIGHDGLSDCYWLCACPEYFTTDSNQLLETSNDTNQMHLALQRHQPEGPRLARMQRPEAGWEGRREAAPAPGVAGFSLFV